MDTFETDNAADPVETTESAGTAKSPKPGPEMQPRSSSKRGLVIALVALVIVIAVGFIAYNALSSQPARTSSSSQERVSSAQASGESQAGSAASETTDAGASSGGSANSAKEALPRLEDYDATIYDEYGDARTLTQIADGKPFVMNFWATWCPFCVQEMDDYQAIVDDYEGRVSFAFIDAADGSRETVDDASKWLFDNGYTLPAYYDTTLEASYIYGAQTLPTTVIVAANGDIMDVSPGRIDPTLMREALDSLLADADADTDESTAVKG